MFRLFAKFAATESIINAYGSVMRLPTRSLVVLAAMALAVPSLGISSAASAQPNPSPTLTTSAGAPSANDGPSTRIVGGVPANRASTPWYVLVNPVIADVGYICGGTAISANWILTAAHCVTTSAGVPMTPTDIWNSGAFVNPVSLSQPGQVYGWSNVVVHPDWNPNLLTNDIALIQTSAPMATTPLAYSSDMSGPTAGTALQIFGMGTTSYGGPLSQTLQLGNVLDLVGTTGTCGGYGQWYHNANQLCAGLSSGAVDSCQGDSGGPLTAQTTAGRNVVGVVSYGYECGHPGYPGVYTRVARYAGWIASTTGVGASAGTLSGPIPGRAVISRSCKSKVCKLKKGGAPLKINVRNAGGQAVSWKLSAGSLKKSRSGGNLASGASIQSQLRAANSKKACIKVTVTGTNTAPTKFKVATNGKKC